MGTKDWKETVDEIFEKQKATDESLFPSKSQMRYVTDIARTIDNYTQLMKNASEMAHQGIIGFEMAQKIMDRQRKNIKRDIKMLQTYLEEDSEE